jgi:hypothetical protein
LAGVSVDVAFGWSMFFQPAFCAAAFAASAFSPDPPIIS